MEAFMENPYSGRVLLCCNVFNLGNRPCYALEHVWGWREFHNIDPQ